MEPLKKALEWLKKNWILVLGLAFAAVMAWQLFAQKAMTDTLAEENKAQFEQHTADLQAMAESHAAEAAAQQEINRDLKENLTRIENEYTTRLSQLEAQVRTRRQTTVRETEGNPDEMARRLRERLGWGAETQ